MSTITKAFKGTNATPTSTLLFYNPSQKLNEMLAYDHPFRIQEDVRRAQPAYHPITAEECGFFEVPTSITITSDELGEVTASIPRMFERVMQLYRERGVVLVEDPDDSPTSRKNDDHVAADKKQAKELGDEFHRNFLRAKCNEWYQIVERIRSEGGVPVAASGLFKYALKKMNYADPADRADTIENERASASSNKAMEAQIQELRDMVQRLTGAQGAKAA